MKFRGCCVDRFADDGTALAGLWIKTKTAWYQLQTPSPEYKIHVARLMKRTCVLLLTIKLLHEEGDRSFEQAAERIPKIVKYASENPSFFIDNMKDLEFKEFLRTLVCTLHC